MQMAKLDFNDASEAELVQQVAARSLKRARVCWGLQLLIVAPPTAK